jgi:predicted small lipoprotein YifL
MKMNLKTSHVLVPLALVALVLAACGKKPEEQPVAATDAAADAQAQQDEAIRAREEELARREQELKLQEKEKELNDREAALTAKPVSKPAVVAAAPKPAAPKPAPKPVAAGPKDYVIPAGTSLSVQLPAEISTKTAKVGQRVSGNLTQDLVVDGKVVAKAGALVQGSVTQVISGSKTIGGKPTLALDFDNLTSEGGDRPMNARVTQVADKSDKAGDTAKIAGGAAVGGVVGHQISHKNGAIFGALIGAAAGTAAAKKTGKEVVLPAGTVVGLTLDSPVTVTM